MMASYSMDKVFGLESRKTYMGIAILWIIGYHFYLVQQEFIDIHFTIFRFLFRNGYVGVDIFFILSAYGLCHSWKQSTAATYYKKRLLRIMPLYIVFLFLCRLTLNGGGDFGIDALRQITGLSVFNTSFTRAESMSGEWFVPALINLYILFPLLYSGIEKLIDKYSDMGVYVLIILSVVAARYLPPYISPNYITRFPIIVIGILTYIYLRKGEENKMNAVYVFTALFLFIVDKTGLALSVVVPLVLKGLNDIKLNLNMKWLSFLGTISFELYLAHVIPMNFISDKSIISAALLMISGTVILALLYKGVNHIIKEIR